jgi:hypothetical protein
MKEQISDIKSRVKSLKDEQTRLSSELSENENILKLHSDTRSFLLSFSEFSRNRVKSKIEDVVNTALKVVFQDQSLKFVIIPAKTKRGIVYELYLTENGKTTPLFNANGGGVLDVIALALRVAFVKFFEGILRQVIFIDEPFKHLSEAYIPNAASWLAMISLKFEIQFIVVTHIQDLVDQAQRIFQFKKKDGSVSVQTINMELEV